MEKLKALIKLLKGILISSGRRPLCCILIFIILWILGFYKPIYNDTGPPDADKVRLIASVEAMIISDDKYELTVCDVVTEEGKNYCNRLKLFSGNTNKSKREDEPLPDLKIGNTISFNGTIKSFRPPGNPGQFNEQAYYRSQGIDARCFVSDIRIINDDRDEIANALYKVRGLFRDAFYKLLPGKEAGIITAMVLGEKQGLDEDVKELYRENGIAHILAISGLHISMIGMGLFFILRKTLFSLKVSAVITGFILFLYGQLTGFPVATRRAFTMTLILLIAKFVGERFDRLNALSLAAIIELITHPESLYQSGFLLSYGTVLGIILFVSEFEKISIGDVGSIRQALFSVISGSMGVSLVTLPIIIQSYHEIPVFSVLVNTLLLPLMSLLLGMSLLGGAVYIVTAALGRFFFGIVYYILQVYHGLCEVVSSFGFSSVIIGHRSAVSIVVYYLILVALSHTNICFYTRKAPFGLIPRVGRKYSYALGTVNESELKKKKPYTVMKLILLFINVLLFIVPDNIPSDLTITNIDVGQGDCACIMCEDKVILIDGGSSDVSEVAKYRIVPFLKYYGIDTIDYMIITHSDADHVNGFEEILNKEDHFGLSIKNVVMPQISGIDKAYNNFEKIVNASHKNLIRICAGDMLRFRDMSLTCLHPNVGYAWEDANDYSTVLELNYKGFKGIFTGDLGFHGEEAVAMRLEDVDYLKVGHHGSKYSSSESFLSKVRPEIAVASAGYKNRYHHPAKEAIERILSCGSTFFSTIDSGAVTTHTDGMNIRVSGFRDE